MSTADVLIDRLGLIPHPEGGYYRETLRDETRTDGRAHSTAIYFLLKAGQVSRWHRIDAVEVWHFYAGAPLALFIAADDREPVQHKLGNDLLQGEAPQLVVPAGAWQRAHSLGEFTLVGCTVAPGFEFSRFELAPADAIGPA